MQKKKGKKERWADSKTNNKETVMLFERALCGIKLRIHLQILVLLFACLPTRFTLSIVHFFSSLHQHRFCRSFTLLFPCGALCMPNVSEKFPFSILILSHFVGVGVGAAIIIVINIIIVVVVAITRTSENNFLQCCFPIARCSSRN